ncbi:hypothetical protein FOL47_001096 [Perkinsus chesapeaki]|uniref:K Homology domain-containing protein n=1 Tax=Perkinsus chesapeaki TaxID=330153 RepID=A0A7J6MK11_PERCH|nr:hypothetical protein FOL47_001096 [Perkinsus chesapeaki]
MPPSREYIEGKAIAFATGPYWIKLLVSNSIAGSIIGPNGSRLSKLEIDTTTVVRISPKGQHFPGTHDRAMVIAAKDIQGISRAVRRVCSALVKLRYQHLRPAPDGTSLNLRLIVPKSSINNLIGLGGSHARRFESITGVNLVVGDRIEGCQERLVDLYGLPDNIAVAVCDISDGILKSDPYVRRHVNVIYHQILPSQPEEATSHFSLKMRLACTLRMFPELNAEQVGLECGAQIMTTLVDDNDDAKLLSRTFVIEGSMASVIRVHSRLVALSQMYCCGGVKEEVSIGVSGG